jgi:hypothetical protein
VASSAAAGRSVLEVGGGDLHPCCGQRMRELARKAKTEGLTMKQVSSTRLTATCSARHLQRS